jgi:hypothetical protein
MQTNETGQNKNLKQQVRALKKGGKSDVPTFLLFLKVFFEIFKSDFRSYLYGVFELLMQRNCKKTR